MFQTHIAENVDEIRLVNEAYNMPYANVYNDTKILTNKVSCSDNVVRHVAIIEYFQTVLAHGIHLSADELRLISDKGASIAHCPASNTCLKSGLCDVRNLLSYGIKVGLGTGNNLKCFTHYIK